MSIEAVKEKHEEQLMRPSAHQGQVSQYCIKKTRSSR